VFACIIDLTGGRVAASGAKPAFQIRAQLTGFRTPLADFRGPFDFPPA